MSPFLPGSSLLHRFDPRIKLLGVLYFSVYTFLPVPVEFLAALFIFLTLLNALVLGLREAIGPVRSIWPILLMIALLTPPFYREDPLQVTALLLLRISTITTLFSMLFRTTDMSRILIALRWYRLPYQAALVVTIAMRYIPYLSGVYHQIQDAHRLRRGSQGEHRRLRERLRSLLPVLTSVMIYAVKSIPQLSMSLEHRGFGRAGKPPRGFKRMKNDFRLFTHFLIFVMMTVIFTAGPYLAKILSAA